MSRADPQVNFRMPAELKARLESEAAKTRRSTTAELIARLESSFSDDQLPFLKPQTRARVQHRASFNRRSPVEELEALVDMAFWYSEDMYNVDDDDDVGPPDQPELASDHEQHEETSEEVAAIVAANEMRSTLSKLEASTYVTAMMALNSTYPDAMTDAQRDRLLLVIARMVDSESRDPTELLSELSSWVLRNIIERELEL